MTLGNRFWGRRCAALLLGLSTAAGLSVALPGTAEARGVSIDFEHSLGGRESDIGVYSPSMDRVITNHVIHAAGPAAPTLYLLPGIGGDEDRIGWWENSDARAFFANKHVNVVMPVGGRSSLYTDWNSDDPSLGRNKWQTYLTSELPPLINGHLGTTGINAIAGLSMSAGSALDLAAQAPELYRAVASYSGCAETSNPVGIAAVSVMVGMNGGNPVNMWGIPGSPQWGAHDPFINAGRLAGKAIYISAATGIPGAIDGTIATEGYPNPPVELGSAACTGLFAARLAQLGIPATFMMRPQGAHTWGLFETDLHDSWATLAPAIGA